MKFTHYVVAAILSLMIQFASGAHATGGCCHHCGCQDGSEKVCRLVREDRKVTITCWGCKCEDFCAPGKSQRICKNVEEVCDDCDPSVCRPLKDFVWYDWEPGCAKHIYSRKKLMKKTVTKMVPSFKWVVEDLCPGCQATCPCALIPAGTSIPSPPLLESRILGGITLDYSNVDAEIVPVSQSPRGYSHWLQSLFSAK